MTNTIYDTLREARVQAFLWAIATCEYGSVRTRNQPEKGVKYIARGLGVSKLLDELDSRSIDDANLKASLGVSGVYNFVELQEALKKLREHFTGRRIADEH